MPAIPRVMVSFGLRDSRNATALALDALHRLRRDISVTVVLGRNAPHIGSIRPRVAECGNWQLRIDVDNMADLYSRNDVAVGAGGVSCLERLCCGLPSVLISLADNQIATLTDWDFSSLADLLLDLDGLGVDLDVTGFDASEIEDLMTWTPDKEHADKGP